MIDFFEKRMGNHCIFIDFACISRNIGTQRQSEVSRMDEAAVILGHESCLRSQGLLSDAVTRVMRVIIQQLIELFSQAHPKEVNLLSWLAPLDRISHFRFFSNPKLNRLACLR